MKLRKDRYKMNTKKLLEVGSKNVTAKRIIEFVSERRRNTVYTAFSGLRADLKKKYGEAPDREHFDQAFKDLQAMGVGKLNCSKRGVCLGFTWSKPIRDLARAIKNVEVEPAAATVATVEIEPEATNPGLTRKPVTVILIRRNRAPVTIETTEAAVSKLA